jgi:3-oxoacyl-[acyl-carrier-protein] synthase II
MGDMRTVEEGMTIMRDRGAEQIPPTGLLKVIPSSLPAHLAIHFGMRGPSFGVSSACASSTHAIGEAYRMIQRGDADVVLAGGAEASVTPLTVASFAAMQVLSRQNEPPYSTPRPFDRRRDGCVIGEGSGMLVLERLESARERGARIDAEVVGYGLTADAFHAGAMRPDAEECARAIRQALASAGVEAEQIDHVNAHGTATLSNDRVETLALRSALGPHAAEAPVSATKSMTGHLLSAGGAVETIAAVLAILTQKMHPTVNLTESDPECDLDYVPGMARVRSVRYALKNSFGFGGHNAVLVLKRWEE